MESELDSGKTNTSSNEPSKVALTGRGIGGEIEAAFRKGPAVATRAMCLQQWTHAAFVRFDDIGTICPVERFLYIIAARRQKSHEDNK